MTKGRIVKWGVCILVIALFNPYGWGIGLIAGTLYWSLFGNKVEQWVNDNCK